MSIKKSLLNGVSAVALTVVAAAPAGAVGNFQFGTSGNDVTVMDSLPVVNGAITSLSSQINNALNISTLVNSVTADGVIGIGIEAGSSTTGGPASASNNGFIALTVANQFTASSAAPNSAYVIDPNGIPPNGYATVGTSQINLDMNNASATLGAIGQAGASGGSNTVTFTDSYKYGAPVTLNINTFAATVTGNLTSSAISGNLPAASVGGTSSAIASGTTASAIITGVGTSSGDTNSPVGTAIATVAPISVTNVQQNIDPTSGTTMSANNYNSLVGATYTGADGQAGGPVQTSLNTISSTAYANSATLAATLTGGNATEINSGVLVFNAQGNAGNSGATGTTLILDANVQNATIYAQAMSGIIGEGGSGSSNTALNQFHNSNVIANGNTIAAVARLNNVTQNLSTDGALIANGALGGSGTLVIAPGNNYSAASFTAGLSTSDATVTANADYVNFGYQHNLSNNPGNYAGEGGVQASSLNDNANIGIFGGMVNGAATVGGNTIQAMTTGNQASVTTTLARAVAGAASITGQYQSNTDGLDLTAAVNAPSLMISDNQGLTTELTNPLYASVAPAQAGSTYSNATLTIGSATAGDGDGNAITAQVIGNNATATAAVNEAIPSSVLGSAHFYSNGTAPQAVSGATGTLTVLDPTTSVLVMQDNLNLGNLTTTVTSPGTNNDYGSVFQIDAVGFGGSGGLPGGSATIGYNTVNANSVGNLAAASANMTSGSNMLNGGVAVVTQQGNSNGVVSAKLDDVRGISAIIDVGQAAQDTGIVGSNVSIIGNSFGALALGNSAQGSMVLPSTAIAGGVLGHTGLTVYSNSTDASLGASATYLVGNVQNNLGVAFSASNAPNFSSDGTISTGMVIGAGKISNTDTVSVASNSLSTTSVGNEYTGTLANYMPAASNSSGFTSAAVANFQNNSGSTFTSTLGTTTFVVGVVNTPQDVQGGVDAYGTFSSTDANSIIANSSVSVANNALTAIARGNSAALSMTGLGTSVAAGFENGSYASAAGMEGFTGNGLSGTGIGSWGIATLTNSQINNFSDVVTSITTTSIAAGVDRGVSGIFWANTSAASVTSSNLAVVGNTVTAQAQGNTASQVATIGGTGGSIYEAGLALVSDQYNVGQLSGSVSGTTQSAMVLNQWFSITGGDSAALVTASQLHVDNNSVAASSTLNANIQSVTASAGSIVYGPTGGGVMAASGEGENAVQSHGAIVANNLQGNLEMASVAGTSNTTFSNAGTVFSDSTLTVNGNSVVSTAIGNTATTTAVLPLLDSTVMVGNSQVNGFSAITATNLVTMLQNSAIAGSGASNTVALANTPVSVTNNLVSAVATVNNFAATISGLGQDGSSVNRYGNAFTGFSGPSVTASTVVGNAPYAPYVDLVNAQSAMSQFALASTVNTTINISAQNVANAGFTVAQNSPLTVSGNTVTSQVSGNIASQTVNATGTGSSQIAGGISVANAQDNVGLGNVGFGYSGVTSMTDITVLSATGLYPQTFYPQTIAPQTIANSPVTITSNTVGSQVTGNQSTQSMAFASTVNAGGAGTATNASVITPAGSVSAYADYVLANSQTNSLGTIAAQTMNTTIGYSGTAVQSPVNVNNNYVYAAAYGNNASMSMTAPLSTGSMQSSNFQSNNGVSISAAVTNTMVMANFAGGTTSNGAVNVNGNIVRAQAVGNVVGSTIKAN